MAGGELVEDRGAEEPAQLEARNREPVGDRTAGFETRQAELEPQPDRQLVLAPGLGLFRRPFQRVGLRGLSSASCRLGVRLCVISGG